MSNNFLRYLEANSYKFTSFDSSYNKDLSEFFKDYGTDNVFYGTEGLKESFAKIVKFFRELWEKFVKVISNFTNKIKIRKMSERISKLYNNISQFEDKEKLQKAIKEKLDSKDIHRGGIKKDNIVSITKDALDFYPIAEKAKDAFQQIYAKFPNIEVESLGDSIVFKSDTINSYNKNFKEFMSNLDKVFIKELVPLLDLEFTGSLDELKNIGNFYSSFEKTYLDKFKGLDTSVTKFRITENINKTDNIKAIITACNNTYVLVRKGLSKIVLVLNTVYTIIEQYIVCLTEAYKSVQPKDENKENKEGNESFEVLEDFSYELNEFKNVLDVRYGSEGIKDIISNIVEYIQKLWKTILKNLLKIFMINI